MNYAVANSEGVFIRQETLEDDGNPSDDCGYEDDYHVGQKRRIFESLTGSLSKRGTRSKIDIVLKMPITTTNDTFNNEQDEIEDLFYPRDILSKITGDMDKIDVSDSDKNSSDVVRKCSKLDDKEWRRTILDVAELIYCNEEMLDFELHAFRTQLMPQTYLKKNLLQKKAEFFIKRLKLTKDNEEINEKLIFEFKRFALETIVNIILFGVARDTDKPDSKYHPLLLVTKTQWVFLKLMFRLEEEKMSNVLMLYLQKSENLLYSRCSQSKVEPVTRLYVAICKLKGDVNRVRRFCCEAFYYTEDLAVTLMFTVLTSWVEIFPMQDDMKCFPIAEVMVQLIHLKTIKKPQYKLHALKLLLNQYYGYSKERVNCDEFLKDLTQKYLTNPTKLANFAIRLYCKYREANWLKDKINEIFKPMVHQVPVGDNKLKATLITLSANVCQHLHLGSRDKYMLELKSWFSSLSGGNTPKLIKQSVQYALNILQKKQVKSEIRAKRRTDLIQRDR